MSYVVLARKWRPMRFEDLVGQEHVSRTLGNAIKAGRVAHAFLFTGVRGVGKTTSARILAKALNCLGDPETTKPGSDPGPTVTPCLKCAACVEIAAGSDVDVWEIDGASYNGVDEVRKLQDSLPYRPQRDRYKVYIVDEVHMLSQNAWNAFLKTLEEPPPHVKFIFATTEVHKVPVTILSRVQRFDFKLIAAQVIARRLRYVLGEEKVSADDAAISLISREAAGSMRDAMSLLDQVIAWGGEELRGEEVARVLGVASRSVLFQLAGALTAGDAERCLRIVADLTEQGYDLAHAARDLLAILRDLVVAKVCADPGTLLDMPDQEVKDVFELARGASNDDLLRLHQGFSAGFDEVVKSGQPRAALEMLLVRLARRPPLLPIDDLIGRLGALERRLAGGPSAATRERPPAPRAEAPPPATSARPREARTSSASEPAAANGRDEPPAPAPAPAPAPVVRAVPKPRPGEHEFVVPADLLDPSLPAPKPRVGPASVAPVPRSPTRAKVEDEHQFIVPDDLRDPAPPADANGAPGVTRAVRTPPARPALPPAVSVISEQALVAWRAIVGRVSNERPELGAFLARSAPLEVEAGSIKIGFGATEPFVAQVQQALASIEQAASEHYGAPTKVVIDPDEKRAAGIASIASLDAEEEERKRRAALVKVKNHPRVTEAVEVLGARLKELKLAER
jgi:DNA polymerase-3 subunit gamma/tau